jgi:MFS family permease
MRRALLAVGVGLALADSSIVTLALPDILGQFDVGITSVAWVLTSFNLVLALVAVPAAYVSRRRPREAFAAGVVVFAAASLTCGLAPSFDVLVGARCVQALGAALVVTPRSISSAGEGSNERALRVWVAAGVLGAALGPAAGGILTQLLGWESIFLAQVPVALVLLLALRGVRARPVGHLRAVLRSRPTLPSCSSPEGWWRPLPGRASARRRLGNVAGRCRNRRDRDAAHGDRRPAAKTELARHGAGRGVRRDPARGWADRARPHAAAGWGWTIPPQILVGAASA